MMTGKNVQYCHRSSLATYATVPNITDGHLVTNIAIVCLNLLSSVTGVVANGLLILSFILNNRLKSVPNTILIALAFSDLLVTALAQPLYIFTKIQELFAIYNCALLDVSTLSLFFTSGISLVTVGILSLERYIALAYPYQYTRLVTYCRMKLVISFSWLLILLLLLSHKFRLASYAPFFWLSSGVIIFCVVIITVVWIWIDRLVCRHRRNINKNLVDVNDTMYKQKLLQKIRTSYLLVLLVLCCFLPTFIVLICYSLGVLVDYTGFYLISPWAQTILFANSVANPLLLFWRSTPFKETAKKILNVKFWKKMNKMDPI